MHPSDVMFVFAGAKSRKLHAIRLFTEGKARRLILSTSRFELRRNPELPIVPKPDLIGMAQPIPAPERHCFVVYPAGEVIWVKIELFGTLTEVLALRDWLRANTDVRTLTLISSGYHLPRIRFCCEKLLPPGVAITYEASPEAPPSIKTRLKEAGKRLIYRAILARKTTLS